jgi:hypothetical protein
LDFGEEHDRRLKLHSVHFLFFAPLQEHMQWLQEYGFAAGDRTSRNLLWATLYAQKNLRKMP